MPGRGGEGGCRGIKDLIEASASQVLRVGTWSRVMALIRIGPTGLTAILIGIDRQ